MLYLVIVILLGFIIFGIAYPISVKRKFIDEAMYYKLADDCKYSFKITVLARIVMLFLGVFQFAVFDGIAAYGLHISHKMITAEIIFIAFVALLGLVFLTLSLINVFIYYPRAYIIYENGTLTYFDGNKRRFETDFSNIRGLEFSNYYKSFFWLIVLRMNDFNAVTINILNFERPGLIYAILAQNVKKHDSFLDHKIKRGGKIRLKG